MRKVIPKVYNVVYGVRNADFGLQKQISKCESRFRGAKGGFWSVKTGIGVRKRFPRRAGEFFLPALRAGEFFSPEITAGNFFLRSLPPPPPIKIKWSLPNARHLYNCIITRFTSESKRS